MIDLVIKIGSMALIRKEDNDIDYNIFSRLASQLRPGMILVSSGATEIGRVDYIKRTGQELYGDPDMCKTDYAAQGQSILMETYRRFTDPRYSLRQVLVEHNHFNDPAKRKHLQELLDRAAKQHAIPVINYNDCISDEENRKMELMDLHNKRPADQIVECVDNDETAAVVSELMHSEKLILLTSVDGIMLDPSDPSTLIPEVAAKNEDEMKKTIAELQGHCHGASRSGANGAGAKLEYAMRCALTGTHVIIGSPRFRLSELIHREVPCTHIYLAGGRKKP
ncbi:MAG: uridylate kinase [Clostridia bacterium]|nr:uridylate kinase [Clostridia bacterium]